MAHTDDALATNVRLQLSRFREAVHRAVKAGLIVTIHPGVNAPPGLEGKAEYGDPYVPENNAGFLEAVIQRRL